MKKAKVAHLRQGRHGRTAAKGASSDVALSDSHEKESYGFPATMAQKESSEIECDYFEWEKLSEKDKENECNNFRGFTLRDM